MENNQRADSAAIRLLQLDDRERLLAFFLRLSEKETHYYYPHALDQANAERLCGSCGEDNNIRLVAVDEDAIVGYLHIDYNVKRAGHLGICILPKYQSAGLGTALFEKAIFGAKERQLTEVALTVHQDNIRVLRLYQKMGFVIENEFLNQQQQLWQYRMLLKLVGP